VEAGDASMWLVVLSETRLGSSRELILLGMYIDRLIHRSGTDVDCWARNGETAGCANTGDVASLGALGAERGILVVAEAVGEAFAVSVDDCRYHAATEVPGRRL
jgi:hypothetical protein